MSTLLPTTDEERFALVRAELYTPVIGDVLDSLGETHRFLPAAIRGIAPAMNVVGRAMPVLIADVFGERSDPFGRLTEALDQLQPGEVYLARNARTPCAAWGELMTAAARTRGAVGAVIDGYHRDTPGVLAQEWPVFSRGAFAQDARVRTAVVDFRVDAEIAGVLVRPGDLVVGDVDGVVVVPARIEDEVLELAREKASAERVVRRAIEGGMSTTDAFREFGVL